MTPLEFYSQYPSDHYAEKLEETKQFLQKSSQDFMPLVQATSLGVEDMVITDLICNLNLPIQVSMLDTGQLHPETLALKSQAENHYDIKIKCYYPDEQTVQTYIEKNGVDAIYQSVELRKECCHIRKLIPLNSLLQGYKGWITGLRKEQSAFRANLQMTEQEHKGPDHPQVKLNPLLEWTNGDIWYYVKNHRVPYNPLHDQFFVSIGCKPCTRAITLGEDFRAGRWWWEQDEAKECGLHLASALPFNSRNAS